MNLRWFLLQQDYARIGKFLQRWCFQILAFRPGFGVLHRMCWIPGCWFYPIFSEEFWGYFAKSTFDTGLLFASIWPGVTCAFIYRRGAPFWGQVKKEAGVLYPRHACRPTTLQTPRIAKQGVNISGRFRHRAKCIRGRPPTKEVTREL